MDPFTQRMLERARARQEKIDQKLANSGQAVSKRKPLSENVAKLKSEASPAKSPSRTSKDSVLSPKKTSIDSVKSPNRRNSVQKSDQSVGSPQRARNDLIVTRKEFKSPRTSKGNLNRRNSDVSVEINITHSNDIQIEVQVEEIDAPINVTYEPAANRGNNVVIKEIEDKPNKLYPQLTDMEESRTDRSKLRKDVKSRLDRLGNLYSDKPTLSSPIHRTEAEFTAGTPPTEQKPRPAPSGGRKFGRLAALADQINNWEDDLTHHSCHPEPTKKDPKVEKLDASTLDVSIHSYKDINKVLQTSAKKTVQTTKPGNSSTYTKSQAQRLDKNIVAELEGEGYRRVSAGQSRLVYDFTASNADRARQEPKCASTTPSAAAAPNMATMVVTPPAVTKKPSIKKYKAPTPPLKILEDSDSDKDKENNDIQKEENDNIAIDDLQTNDDKPVEKCSPVVKRLVPKLNGNTDRSSVLSKAAMFEAGSPRAKDPAEMSLRERKALFEKNKGAAIVPKAPFGLAPSVKTLHGDTKDKPRLAPKPSTPTKPVIAPASSIGKLSKSSTTSSTTSRDEVTDDNVSQTSVGGGIKGKLAALFSKEQTISESTIANKFKLEREREMEMLQNRFQYKPEATKSTDPNDSDDDHSESDPSEKAPLMGSTTSLALASRKPEIIANIPKNLEKTKTRNEPSPRDETGVEKEKVIGSQPVKRRSSQDSPVVLSVLEDVKRIKVNTGKKEQANGAVLQQPGLYPHLSDIETDNSHQEEYSDCGGSSTEDSPDTEPLNKSDNWAETSFGREVMNVVKRNNTSYKKAVASDSEESAADSELDELLDEALGEGPTPPKVGKHGTLSSESFVYSEKGKFKSPLKAPATPATPAGRPDRGNELVHSVSFYRRMQSASSTPSTPMRVVRRASPSPEPAPAPPATTVRQRIKELQAEIGKQQTVISQASQALNLCAATVEFSGSTEQAEGERLLLLATHRRQACVHEIQRLQVEGAGAAAAKGLATLHLKGINVPLRRDYMRQLHADGALGHHAVCLVKCRDRVLATSMQRSAAAAPALHFPDQVRLDGIASDFKVTVEVYLLQGSKEELPHDVKYHINSKKPSSKLLTPKSKISELKAPRIVSPAGPGAVRAPRLQLHGYCIFAIEQANRKTFTLSKVPAGSPLDGSVHMDITCSVRVPAPAPHAAFLTAFDDVSGLGAWHRRWFRLQPPRLAYWKYPDDVQKKMPIGDIDLTTVISEKVVKAPRDLCARPNTLLIESSVPAGLVPDAGSLVYVRRPDGTIVRRHLLAADTPKDRDVWLECLNNALEYVRCCPEEE